MSEITLLNGGVRGPMARSKDYVTVEKVQAAVNTLLENDRKLHENQETLRREGLTTASRVADIRRELDMVKADEIAIRQRIVELEAKRLGTRLMRAWRWVARSVFWRAD